MRPVIKIQGLILFITMGEIWKWVPGYEGHYKASDQGLVKSFKNGSERILKPCFASGYGVVNLSANSKVKSISVHVIVAMTFLNHVPDGHNSEVDHIDNDKTNNFASNLQIISHRKNMSKDRIGGTSKHTGVHISKGGKKFTSSIRLNGKEVYIGRFDVESDAASVYVEALEMLHRFGPDYTIEQIKLKKKAAFESRIKKIKTCVYFNSSRKKWHAQSIVAGKYRRIGYFDNEADAQEARRNFLIENNHV